MGQQQPHREGRQALQTILKTGSVFWVFFKYQKVPLGLMVPKHLAREAIILRDGIAGLVDDVVFF